MAAKGLLDELVASEPSHRDGWRLLAGVNHRLGFLEDAAFAYERTIALNPRDAEAFYFLGNIHGARGAHDDALRCYRSAVDVAPRSAPAVRNLGATLQLLQRSQEAVDVYRAFLDHAVATPEILQNLGNALSEIGRYGDAVAAYRAALDHGASRPELRVNLGDALEALGRTDLACREYEQALTLDQGCVAAWRQLGAAHVEQGRPEDALDLYRRAVHTGDAGIRIREATVLPAVARSAEDLLAWRNRYEAGIARLAQESIVLEDPPRQAGCVNFHLAYHGLSDRELNVQLARLYERACPSLLWTAPHCRSRPARRKKLRVGFISRFLYAHSIGKTTLGLMEKLSRQAFEVFALFAPPAHEDDMARRIRAASDGALRLPAHLAAAREAIAALELDVLFYQDIGMEAFTYFLAFARLAPFQCTSFGHPDTTGIAAMDCFISSDLFEPADAQNDYSERLERLPGVGTLAYYHRPQIPPARREDFGWSASETIYLCPQTLFKFHPQFDAILRDILAADPAGRLVLIEGAAKAMRERLEARLRAACGGLAKRITFLPGLSGENFSRLVASADVMLDTLHFGGMNTSLEAFAAGTPVVTLPTALQRGRHTAGMYRRMEIDDCVARDAADYVRIAATLGRERERNRALRRKIAERSHVLFEDLQVVREFERVFQTAC